MPNADRSVTNKSSRAQNRCDLEVLFRHCKLSYAREGCRDREQCAKVIVRRAGLWPIESLLTAIFRWMPTCDPKTIIPSSVTCSLIRKVLPRSWVWARLRTVSGACTCACPRPGQDRLPGWSALALFFNLPEAQRPGDYAETTVQHALDWLDQGSNPANPTISEFMRSYWGTLSYGAFSFNVDTPRDDAGQPLVPTIAAASGSGGDWGGLIRVWVEAHPERVWTAAGGLLKDGRRWIPSLVLVQNYWTHASATFGSFTVTIGGVEYEIGDITISGMVWISSMTSRKSPPAQCGVSGALYVMNTGTTSLNSPICMVHRAVPATGIYMATTRRREGCQRYVAPLKSVSAGLLSAT